MLAFSDFSKHTGAGARTFKPSERAVKGFVFLYSDFRHYFLPPLTGEIVTRAAKQQQAGDSKSIIPVSSCLRQPRHRSHRRSLNDKVKASKGAVRRQLVWHTYGRTYNGIKNDGSG